jgi:hypothetical protein
MLTICAWLTYWQVFYHLGELDSALTYALGAGAHFNVDEQSEYVQTLIGEQQELAGHRDHSDQQQNPAACSSSLCTLCLHARLGLVAASALAWGRVPNARVAMVAVVAVAGQPVQLSMCAEFLEA